MLRLVIKTVIFIGLIFLTDRVVDMYLKNGLTRYYGFNRGAKVLCIGHSRSDHAVDRKRLEHGLNVPVAKYALAGMDAVDRLTMIRHYFGEHPGQAKIVVYDVDLFTFNGRTVSDKIGAKQYRQLFPFMDNPDVDEYIKNKSTQSVYLSRKFIRSLRYNDPKVFARAVINHFKSAEIPASKFDYIIYKKYLGLMPDSSLNLGVDPENVRCLEATIQFVKAQHAKLVFLYLPITDLEMDRVEQGYRERVLELLRRYAAASPDVVLVENNRKYEHSYELYYDSLHFNKYGQELATDDLVNVLKPML